MYVDVLLDDPAVEPPALLGRVDDASLFIWRSPTIDASGSAGIRRAMMNATVAMPSSSSGVTARRRRT